MRRPITPVSQVAILGAIAATLFGWPAGAALALALSLFGISFHAVLTFGGAFSTWLGLLAWWLLAFAAACLYAACAFPWGEKVLAWPRKK